VTLAFEGAVDQMRQWRVPLHGCDAWLDGGYFTGDDGHITNRIEIIAAHDEEAKQLAAKQLVDGHAVELWQEGRKNRDIRSRAAGSYKQAFAIIHSTVRNVVFCSAFSEHATVLFQRPQLAPKPR